LEGLIHGTLSLIQGWNTWRWVDVTV
jgi:hypothetical protein